MARAMPVLPLVGSRMIDSGPRRSEATRSSKRYLATRSLTEPVGLTPSSLAYSRTFGVRAELRDLDQRRVPDGVDDRREPAAVPRRALVGVRAQVGVDRGAGIDRGADLERGAGLGRGRLPATGRDVRRRHGQAAPPAMAGRMTIVSRSPVGVASSAR